MQLLLQLLQSIDLTFKALTVFLYHLFYDMFFDEVWSYLRSGLQVPSMHALRVVLIVLFLWCSSCSSYGANRALHLVLALCALKVEDVCFRGSVSLQGYPGHMLV
jgi:hypothetical protein